ncbi:MAG: HAD-IA family hydrolase [Bacteroidota bacterium]
MQIKVVLLDLGGVVFESTGISNEIIDWKIISELNNKYGADLNKGETTVDQFLKEYNNRTKQHLDIQLFLKSIFDTLKHNESLIKRLSVLPIYIVSDNYRENIAYISERYSFNEWASNQFYSFDLALEKTDHRFFPRLLKEIDFPPHELLFIDDSIDKISNAIAVGINAIHFRGNTDLFKKLEPYGI